MSDDFKKSWIEGFNDLAIKLARQYKEDPESVLSSIGFKSIRECLLETYNNLVKQQQITRLEDLDKNHKEALWIKSSQYSEDHFQRIAICKCIYLLDVLTEETK